MAHPYEPLVAVAREVSFLRGAELVHQGEPARGAFVIRSGSAEARVALPGGGALAVARFSEGDLFGEMALVERGVVSATVVAQSNVDAWFIARDDFRALVASRELAGIGIQRGITAALAARLRALNAQVSAHPAEEDRPAGEAPPARAGLTYPRKAAFDWRAFLPALPFFEGFDPDQADELASIGRVAELERGAWLFAAGEEAVACYLVLRGALELFTRREGVQRRVAIAGPGELVGYMAVIDAAPRANFSRAREESVLLDLPRDAFLAIYEGNSATTVALHHAIHRSLMRSIARTNTQLTRLISHMRLHAAAGRAAELEAALPGQIWRAQGAG